MFVNLMLAGAASYYVGAFIQQQGAYSKVVSTLPPFMQKLAPAATAGLVLFGLHKAGVIEAVAKGPV